MNENDRNKAVQEALQRLSLRFPTLKTTLGLTPRYPQEKYPIWFLRSSYEGNRKLIGTWLEIIEVGVEKLTSDIQAQYEDWMDEEPEEEDELLNEAAEEIWRCRYNAITFPYEYFLVCCFAQIELALNDTCKRFARIQNVPFLLKGLRGSKIEKCRTFMKKVLGLPFPDDIQAWTDLVTIGRLRNCIVHQGGLIQGAPDEHRIRQLKNRIASNIPPIKNANAETMLEWWVFDERSEKDVAIARALCEETLLLSDIFIRELIARLNQHFGF